MFWRATAGLGLGVLLAMPAAAEDRVTVHGIYYREHSTRVIEPIISVSKDLPAGFGVEAHYLLDAVSSASVRAGAATDSVFTEKRHEGSLLVRKTFDTTLVEAQFGYSTEPDYRSRLAGVYLTQEVWGGSGALNVSLAYRWDDIDPPPPLLDHKLKVYLGGVLYTQALTPTFLAQVGYETAYFDGFLANPYIQVPNKGHEKTPPRRLRHVFPLRLAKYFPAAAAGAQFYYRYFFDQGPGITPDPWGLQAHTFEGRLFKEVGDFEFRLAYRFHWQNEADFWCNTDPTRGGRTDCYSPNSIYYSADPKLGPAITQLPEIKITWELRWFARVPVLRWFAPGAVDVSYGYYIQDTRYENAHLLQTGYSLPF